MLSPEICDRPETWDGVALSDTRDAIRHVRNSVGAGIPIMGVGFSFGGCLMTAVAGSAPPEEHGLCGLVSRGSRLVIFDGLDQCGRALAATKQEIAARMGQPRSARNV